MKKLISFITAVLTVAVLGLGVYAEQENGLANASASLTLSSANDTYISYQTDYLEMLGIGRVWDEGITGKTESGRRVRICIVDTGIDTDHPDFYDLEQNTVISELSYNASTKETVKDHGLYVIEDTDEKHHGTAVAGMIFAQYGNGVGIAGIAYDAEAVIIKCETQNGSYDKNDVMEGIRYAVEELEGVDVINLSFTSNNSDTETDDRYRALLKKAEQKGITVVAATGNDYASSVPSPARLDGVIAVGALNASGSDRAAYSNYGKELDVLAPGTVVTTYGEGIWVKGYEGTSFAAPIVSGIIALYKCRYPDATPSEIYSALKASSVDMQETGRDDICGYGRVNAERMILGDYGTLTLDLGFGDTESITFLKGAAIQEPLPLPVKDGATFDGWYTDPEFKHIFNDDIRYREWINDSVLYAKWSYKTPLPSELAPITVTYASPDVNKTYDGTGIALSFKTEHVLGNITYRWYKNGILMENETADTVDIPSNCTSDEGDAYLCVATVETDGQEVRAEHTFKVKITPSAPNAADTRIDNEENDTVKSDRTLLITVSVAVFVSIAAISVLLIKKKMN